MGLRHLHMHHYTAGKSTCNTSLVCKRDYIWKLYSSCKTDRRDDLRCSAADSSNRTVRLL